MSKEERPAGACNCGANHSSQADNAKCCGADRSNDSECCGTHGSAEYLGESGPDSRIAELDEQVKNLAAQVVDLTAHADAGRDELVRVEGERDTWQSKATTIFDQYMRVKADFDGFRKRTERDFEDRLTREKSDFMKSLLDVMDNFERFLKAAENGRSTGDTGFDAFHKGVVMIQKQLLETLLREGVEPIESAVGKEMDPEFHDAVAAQDGGGKHGTVLEELQTGYLYKGTVLRPTRVKVAR